MKKFLILGISVAAAFAFNMQVGKTYKCETVGISFKEGNQTKNVLNTAKTMPILKKSLKAFYEIEATKENNSTIKLVVGKIKQTMKVIKPWKGYQRYVTKQRDAAFIFKSDVKDDIAILYLPNDKLMIYYKCK
jgi:hypothetical protein